MEKIISTKEAWRKNSYFTNDKYVQLYTYSINNPEAFWSEKAKCIDWIVPFSDSAIKKVNYSVIVMLPVIPV